MIEKLLRFKNKFNNILQSKSHAILLESEDEQLLKDVACLYSVNLLCESENKPCFKCSQCKKIISENSLDIITFDKTMVVEDVETIIDSLNVVPAENEYKVYIIGNMQECSIRVQNKLLKSLEEPPKFVKFVLLTKNINSLLPTIISRCEKYSLPMFTKEELIMMIGSDVSSFKLLPAIENSNGYYGKVYNYLNNEKFTQTLDLCLHMLKNMKNSSQILAYSTKIIKNKENFELFLTLLQNLLMDISYIHSNCENLIKNTLCKEDLINLSAEFSLKAIIQIVANLDKIKEKLKFNVNFNIIVDAMLLNILEVKHKCKK